MRAFDGGGDVFRSPREFLWMRRREFLWRRRRRRRRGLGRCLSERGGGGEGAFEEGGGGDLGGGGGRDFRGVGWERGSKAREPMS